jgi:hypothetical protein
MTAVTLRGTQSQPETGKTSPQTGKTSSPQSPEKFDYLLGVGKGFLETRVYEAAMKFFISAKQGYGELGQQTKVNECNELINQCVVQQQLPSPTAVGIGSITYRADAAPTSTYRRLISPPSSKQPESPTPIERADFEKTQNLLKRLDGLTFGEKMQFPHIYKGQRGQIGKS